MSMIDNPDLLPFPKKPAGCLCDFPGVIDEHPSHHAEDCPVRGQWLELHRPVKAEPRASSRGDSRVVLLRPIDQVEEGNPPPLPPLGINRVVLGAAEIAQALGYYFEHVIFRPGYAPAVASVSQRGTDDQQEFEVRFETTGSGESRADGAGGSGDR